MKWFLWEPSNSPVCGQQFLKPASGTARARILAAEFLSELFIPVHESPSFAHSGFRRESLPAFARAFVERVNLHNVQCVPYSLHFWWLFLSAGGVFITPPAWILT